MNTDLRIILTMEKPKIFAKRLGQRIAQTRKELGITQVELAEVLQLSQPVIAEYEIGRKNIPIWRLMNVAEVLGVDVATLLSEPQKKKSKRGPPPKLLQQMEKISSLPTGEQKSIIKVLDMALSSV